MDRVKPASDLDMRALDHFERAATNLGAAFERLGPRDMDRIPELDGLLIRGDTDPRNMTYAAARIAEANGIPVLDESDSIAICCNKIHMGRRIQAAGVPTPPTRYLLRSDARAIDPADLFTDLGAPLVLKAPISAFSAFVEKVDTPEEYRKVATRFLRRTDGLVIQAFTPTTFDWRVIVLDGRVLAILRYWMPSGAWRVRDTVTDDETQKARRAWGKVEGVPLANAPKALLATAKAACAAIGQSLYGVDLKEPEPGKFVVIEVNDNPTIYPGYEDQCAPQLFEDILRSLLERGR